MADEKRIVRDIKKQYGAVIDLDRSPLVVIEIIRRFAFEVASGLDGGAPPGGAPPGPPPGPSVMGGTVTLDEVMREVLKLSRQVAQIKKQLGGRSSGG